MHILIFGVGRSGTKAVQLYFSYLLAKRNGRTWINYEPYFWLNRKTGSINYEGLYHHTSSPNLASSPTEFTRSHRRFLSNLSIHEGMTVTKFIRGNGRIGAIKDLLQPDSTIVIVRDLYQVLTSVLRTNWDFLSVGFEYKMNWDSFMQEVRRKGLVENYDWCDNLITDRIDRNAFYWYVMNLAAIEYPSNDVHFIDYAEIAKVEMLARQLFQSEDLPSISDSIFTGDYIHSDYPLLSEQPSFSTKELLNGIFYKSQLTDKYGLFLPTRKVGDSVKLNEDFILIEPAEPRSTKITIEKKELYEFFNQDISKRLAQRKTGQVIGSKTVA
ncbi:MAG: hypothetical protein ACKO1U_08145 [Bacteroidota bacterium]